MVSDNNVHGMRGKNIPMDPHMQHSNRELKCAISHLGATVAPKTIQHVGLHTCLHHLIDIKNNFNRLSGLSMETGWHTSKSFMKNLGTVTTELEKSKVFKIYRIENTANSRLLCLNIQGNKTIGLVEQASLLINKPLIAKLMCYASIVTLIVDIDYRLSHIVKFFEEYFPPTHINILAVGNH